MNKSSEFHHIVSKTIRDRKSTRAFDDRAVEPGKIASLFEAARWAPSSSNEQPWRYIYASKEQPELWKKLFDSLNEGNQIWAKDAPLLIVSMARKNFTRNDQPNGYALYDLGAANSFMALQAVELGLQLRQMGGYKQADVRSSLNIDDSYALGVLMAVGYPGKTELLPELLQARERAPRERFLQDEFALNKSF